MQVQISIPKQAAAIVDTLKKNGYEAYVVGGCVRDSLLGRVPEDWDICTSATPEQTIASFPGFNIIETGLQHGTVTVVVEHKPYEVTTYRVDGGYTDHRRPDSVEFVSRLEDDLARRDFTINAMAYNHDAGLVDCFGGVKDLNDGIVRCVGEANRRFDEDALRIMRALRFASAFEFSIDCQTAKSVHKNKDTLSGIAAERIQVELMKLLRGNGAAGILDEYSDVFAVIIPELSPLFGFEQKNGYHNLDVWQHTVEAVRSSPCDAVLRLALLLHDIAKPSCFFLDDNAVGHFYGHEHQGAEMAAKILRRLKFDNDTIKRVKCLIEHHDAQITAQSKSVKRWLNKIGENSFRQLLYMRRADIMAQAPQYQKTRLEALDSVENCLNEVIKQQQCFCLKDLAVNGNDMIKIGITNGRQIGATLKWLLRCVINDELPNERSPLIESALQYREEPPEINK